MNAKIQHVVFVDIHSRQMRLQAASVTVLNPRFSEENTFPRVVLRFAADLGTIHDLSPEGGWLKQEKAPFLVPNDGYKARSSAGFTEHFFPSTRGFHTVEVSVVGMAGFPWMTKGGLKPVRPFWATLYRPEAAVHAVTVHKNSNPETARAVQAGVQLVRKMYPVKGYILEGQSDYVCMWEISPHPDAAKLLDCFSPEFEIEHNLRVFSTENILQSAVRRTSLARDHGQAGEVLVYASLARAMERGMGSFPEELDVPGVQQLLGFRNVGEMAAKKLTSFEESGWKTSDRGQRLVVCDPAGKEVGIDISVFETILPPSSDGETEDDE